MSVDRFVKTRGGKRESAGRKKGSSVYGETTQAIRVPESLLPRVKNLLAQRRLSVQKPDRALLLWPCENPDRLLLPLFSGKVAASFPSPADDYIEKNAGFKRAFGTKTRFCKIFLSLLNNWRKDSVYQAVAE